LLYEDCKGGCSADDTDDDDYDDEDGDDMFIYTYKLLISF